jgi:N-methylhydantoinase A
VIVPWSPGTFSAWGMLQTDMRHDLAKTFYRPLAGLEAGEVAQVYRDLEREGAELLRGERVPDEDMYFSRSADMRYVGQEYSVNVPAGTSIDLGEIDAAFHDAHRVRYGHSTPGAPVELVNLRVAVFGRISAAGVPYRPPTDGEDARITTRSVVFAGEPRETDVLLRARMRPGERREGPAIVEEDSSTTVVPPGYAIEVDDVGNLLVTRAEGEGGDR